MTQAVEKTAQLKGLVLRLAQMFLRLKAPQGEEVEVAILGLPRRHSARPAGQVVPG